MAHTRGKGSERETGEGIYEILTDGGFLYSLFAGHHIALFWHSSIFSFSLSCLFCAPDLTVFFSSDTPDYSRLPSAALIIFFLFFLLLQHRYVDDGMRQFEGGLLFRW